MVLLIRAFPNQYDPDRTHHNLQIQPDGIILDVVQIIFGVQMHRLVAATVDLPPTRETGWDSESFPLPWLVFIDEKRHLGTRAHEAHCPSQDVEKLREFVEAEAAQETSHVRDARIILRLMNQISI